MLTAGGQSGFLRILRARLKVAMQTSTLASKQDHKIYFDDWLLGESYLWEKHGTLAKLKKCRT